MEAAEEKVAAYLSQPHRAVIYEDRMEDGSIVYMALDPDLPGCMSHGETAELAETNLEDARDSYVRTLLSMNIPLPERPCLSLGTIMSSCTVSVALNYCEPEDQDVLRLQQTFYDHRRAGSAAYA